MPPPSVHVPWAFKTAFGWCMAGPTDPPTEGRGPVVCAQITTKDIHHRNLETLVEKFWETEEKEDKSPSSNMSEEDRRGEEILKSSIKVVNGHFEVAAMDGLKKIQNSPTSIHWRSSDGELPTAPVKRIRSWEKKSRKCWKTA